MLKEVADEKAQSRNPFILKCCVVPESLISKIDTNGTDWQTTVQEALLDFEVPRIRQDGGRLRVCVPEKVSASWCNAAAQTVREYTGEQSVLKKLSSMQYQIYDLQDMVRELRRQMDELRHQRNNSLGKPPAVPEDVRPRSNASFWGRLFWWRSASKSNKPAEPVRRPPGKRRRGPMDRNW